MKLLITLMFFMLTSLVGYSAESDHAGVVVKVEGNVDIYQPVEGKSEKASVLYEGRSFLVGKAKLGTRVYMDNLVRTGPTGKLKIVYRNGDQYTVGENTSYKIYWDKGKYTGGNVPTVNLMYGKIRAVISKEGPRKELAVKTKVAALGVRGTDFYVENQGLVRGTDVSVLRGEVAVESTVVKAPEVKVTQGFTAQVKSQAIDEAKVEKVTTVIQKSDNKKVDRPVVTKTVVEIPVPTIQLIKTSQEELVQIQKDSVVKVEEKEAKVATPEVKKEIEVLEKKAVEVVVKDIQTHDPKLLAVIDVTKVKNSESLNTRVVEEIYKEAPKAPAKASFRDLDYGDEDPYKKYFKIDD